MQGCPTLLAGEVTCLCAGAEKGHRPHSLPYEKTTAHIHKWCCACQRWDTCWGIAPHAYWGWPSAELLCEHPLQSGCWMISPGVSSRTLCLNLPHRLKRSSEVVQIYFPSIQQQISTDENLAEIYPNFLSPVFIAPHLTTSQVSLHASWHVEFTTRTPRAE